MGKCKVLFSGIVKRALDSETIWPPLEAESLWAEQLTPNSARLLNSPFYARGVSYLDEVGIKGAGLPDGLNPLEVAQGFYEFESVLKHSGHGTVRAILISEDVQDTAQAAIDEIELLGCTWEGAGACLSIDIPPEVDKRAVMGILERASFEQAIYVDVGFLPE